MRVPAACALAGALAFASVAFAADTPKAGAEPGAANPQQERMRTCNADAKGKTGEERKKFMSACLSGEAPKMTRQDRMKSCNAKAGPMKGDERRKFMSSCLSG